ncbi:alanine racemase [bacterium]|nr:alanine racemase [bacterium]
MTVQSIESSRLRAWVDVDLSALRRNGEMVARHAGVPLLPMIKADAYGLGAAHAARALESLDLVGFGVATVREGEELRALGVVRPVLVFSPLTPADLMAARAAGLTPTLGSASAIASWREQGGGDWHLAIDTGMHRAGARWDTVGDLAELLRAAPPVGAFTHFHSSELDDGSMELQEQRFRDALAALPARPALVHADNSAAIVRRSPSAWSFVRPGVFLYGVGSGAALQPEPVAHVRARVVELRTVRPGESVSYDATWRATRESTVATIPLGYADGYRRSLSNVGRVLLNGGAVPVAGNVTMDMTMLDVTDVPCAVGDIVTVMGRAGDHLITAEQVGAACGLSPYELLTGLRQRLPRIYG